MCKIFLKYNYLLLFIIGISVSRVIFAQDYQLKEALFYKGKFGGIWEVWRTKDPHLLPQWDTVSLPHCYNEQDIIDRTPGYYQGEAWYKTTFDINFSDNERVLLKVEGGGPNIKIFIYNKLIGTTQSAYHETIFDITDFVRWAKTSPSLSRIFNNKIPITFNCDNSRNLNQIPSDLNDFPLYGGLFRKISISIRPDIYIDRVYATPAYDSVTRTGLINIRATVTNPKNKTINELVSIQLSSNDSILFETEMNIRDDEISINTPQFENILLWSPDAPNLYTLRLIHKTNNLFDTSEVKIGFKFYNFEKKGRFHLNGETVFLKGVHRHEDHAGFGPAIPDSITRKEFTLIKKMGANFIRLAHYQQSDYVISLCDSLGILVWEEIPWSRGGLGPESHKQHIYTSLNKMIKQHYNHPSIFIWGLGNELDRSKDFPTSNNNIVRAMLISLDSLAKSLDNERYTALRRCEFCTDITDIYSPSIWAGWYKGSYKDYEFILRDNFEKFDRLIHAEWGVSSHSGRHVPNPYITLKGINSTNDAIESESAFLSYGGSARVSKDGDWSETYACDLVDWHLSKQAQLNWFSGSLYWTFKDFATPIRPDNPIPYINQKGIVSRNMEAKEIYYVFQSYWTKEPMVHIYGSNWNNRWNYPDSISSLKVYSNCDSVELFVNNNSQGVKKRDINKFPAAGLEWKQKFNNREYTIKAIGFMGTTPVIYDTLSFNYRTRNWGEVYNLTHRIIKTSRDVVFLKIIAKDKNDNICKDANNLIDFDITGDGVLMHNLGTVYGSKRIELSNGVGGVYVNINKGHSVVSIKSEGLKTNFIELSSE